MSERFHYNVKFANRPGNMANELESKNLAKIEQKVNVGGAPVINLRLDLPALDTEMFKNGYHKDDGLNHIYIGIDNDSIYYYIRWVPDDRIVRAISKHFPEDVLSINETYTRGYPTLYYVKDGELSLIDGTPVKTGISFINSGLIQEYDDFFRINLPIGDTETEKWGTIFLPKKNITCIHGHYLICFDKDYVLVSFPSGKVRMRTEELCEKYRDSKNAYKQDMRKLISIEGLNRESFIERYNQDMGNSYYVVKIPCFPEISEDGFMSITASDYDVTQNPNDIHLYNICLGENGKIRNVMIIEDGEKIRKEFTNRNIKEIHDAYIREINPPALEEETERE